MKEKIIELLKTLPEPYATQAVENYDPSFCEEGAEINDNNDALERAFDWEKSKQGGEHWAALRRHLKLGEPLPYSLESKTDARLSGDLSSGFIIGFMQSWAMQKGKAMLMLHPDDYKVVLEKQKTTDSPTS